MRSYIFLFLLAFGFTHILEASPRNWGQFIDITARTGQLVEANFGKYKYLQDIDPANISQPHSADYVSLNGEIDSNGDFQFSRVEFVSENWKINADGNWDVDQWMFSVTKEGVVTSASHMNLVETMGRSVLKHDAIIEDESVTQDRYIKILNAWYSRIGLD